MTKRGSSRSRKRGQKDDRRPAAADPDTRLHEIHQVYGLGVLAGLTGHRPEHIKCKSLPRGGIKAAFIAGFKDGYRRRA